MKKLFFVPLLLLLLLPITAAGYTTTDQRAYRVNDTTALYYIEYAFGHENYDLYLPVLATRGQDHGDGETTIGYEIIQDDDFATKTGVTRAAAIASAPIVDGMYKIAKGYSVPFTLAVILTVPEGTNPAAYAVQVTDLPFYMATDEDRKLHRLNPSELQYYETGGVNLNRTDLAELLDSIHVEVINIEYTTR